MTNTTQQERIDKQEKDDGNMADNVLYYRSPDTKHYHEDYSCASLNKSEDEMKTTTRKEAQLKWLAPCSRCVL